MTTYEERKQKEMQNQINQMSRELEKLKKEKEREKKEKEEKEQQERLERAWSNFVVLYHDESDEISSKIQTLNNKRDILLQQSIPIMQQLDKKLSEYYKRDREINKKRRILLIVYCVLAYLGILIVGMGIFAIIAITSSSLEFDSRAVETSLWTVGALTIILFSIVPLILYFVFRNKPNKKQKKLKEQYDKETEPLKKAIDDIDSQLIKIEKELSNIKSYILNKAYL